MVFLLLGGATLVALMLALGLFSGAQVRTVKTFGIWVVALGGLVLAALLFLSGRGAAAMGDLLMLGIVIWPWLQQHFRARAGPRGGAPAPAGPTRGRAAAPPARRRRPDAAACRARRRSPCSASSPAPARRKSGRRTSD